VIFDREDERWMRRALDLAEASAGLASPNPQVGCVLVREGQILGEGAHAYDRLDHAEIVALKQAAAAGHHAAGATAYVTLEPCSHHGRTGPCADALIAAQIGRCVVATVDPNPQVSGRGLAKLREAGIAVQVGVLEPEARRLNDAFAWSITRERPFVTLKAALSVDGHLAPPDSLRTANQPFWLTGPEARAEVQRMRHGSDAILTGIGTVLADDPALTDRSGLPRRRPLTRIVLDRRLRIPASAQLLLDPATVWIFHAPDAAPERRQALAAAGVRLTELASAPDAALPEVLEHLHRARLLSVMLECGSALNGAFLASDLVDRAVLFYAATELGPRALPFARGAGSAISPFALEQRMLSVSKQGFGEDVRVAGNLHDPWPPATG
jgi:diaminohydroxyphosphoribosylaminopyrimidine deaminase/5-amino-6-(5-phosphoribosylamino)uracil reductase